MTTEHASPWVTLCETLDVPARPLSGAGVGSRWAVQVEGEADDLTDLERLLNGSYEAFDVPSVVKMGKVVCLTTRAWEEKNDPAEISALAETILNDCVACINLLHICGLLRVGTIYEFHGATCTMTRYSRVKLTIKNAGDKRASPAQFRLLYGLCATEGWLTDCLPLYYKEPDFYLVYKAVEAIMGYCGGEHSMRKRADFNGSKLSKVKNVADFHRHIQKPNRQKPVPFYSLQECLDTVTSAIGSLINEKVVQKK